MVLAGPEQPGGMERLIVRIEHADDPALRAQVIECVRTAVSLRPDVELVARGAIYDQERSIKTRRIVDLRPAPE